MESYRKFLDEVEKENNITIPEDVVKKVLPYLEEEQIKRKEVVLCLGEIPKKSYCIIEGIMRSYYIDMEGRDRTKYFHIEGTSSCGEGIFNQSPSIMCVEALTDCKVLAINCMKARKLIYEDEFLMKLWIRVLEESLIYKTERESSFLLKSATERYLDFRKELGFLEKRVNSQYIASYLGMTPVSLSRIKHALKNEKNANMG